MELEPYSRPNELSPQEKYARDKAVLSMRRKGCSYDQIAEELGLEDRFHVIDLLNDIYKRLQNTHGSTGFRPDIREVVDFVDSKIDDLISVFYDEGMGGDIKAARFVLDAVKLKVQIHGGISPTQINVSVNNEKPWAKVYKAVLPNDSYVEGEIVD